MRSIACYSYVSISTDYLLLIKYTLMRVRICTLHDNLLFLAPLRKLSLVYTQVLSMGDSVYLFRHRIYIIFYKETISNYVSIVVLLPHPEGKGNSRYRFKYLSISFLSFYKQEALNNFFPKAQLEMFDRILDFYNLHKFVWRFHLHIYVEVE